MNDLEVLRMLCESVEREAIRLARSERHDDWDYPTSSREGEWPFCYTFEHGDGKRDYRQRVIDRMVRGDS